MHLQWSKERKNLFMCQRVGDLYKSIVVCAEWIKQYLKEKKEKWFITSSHNMLSVVLRTGITNEF